MDGKMEKPTATPDLPSGMLAWWGLPAATERSGNFADQIKRMQVFATDLQRAYGDVYSRQMEAVFKSNERLGRSLQGLFQSRSPDEVMAAESEILATVIESASLQAANWAELGQKFQDCCAAIIREASEDMASAAAKPAARRSVRTGEKAGS